MLHEVQYGENDIESWIESNERRRLHNMYTCMQNLIPMPIPERKTRHAESLGRAAQRRNRHSEKKKPSDNLSRKQNSYPVLDKSPV